MCTLVVLHRCVEGRPLVVAANRDEFLARPAEDIALRSSGTGPILAPLDLEAGGTWVGLSQRGVFAGLTNLRPLASRPPGAAADASGSRGEDAAEERELESRGSVVMAALEAESAADAVRTLSQLKEVNYNPFQLVVADGRDAFLVVYRDRPRVIELEPGPHIVGNVEDEKTAARLGVAALLDQQDERERAAGPQEIPGFEGIDGLVSPTFSTKEPRALKLTRIRERVEQLVMEPEIDLFEGLARVCREHVGSDGIESPFEATCVHIPEGSGESEGVADRYGTRSSLLLELCEDEGSSRLWATDGAPCRRPFENRSSLLKDLGVRLGSQGRARNDARKNR